MNDFLLMGKFSIVWKEDRTNRTDLCAFSMYWRNCWNTLYEGCLINTRIRTDNLTFLSFSNWIHFSQRCCNFLTSLYSTNLVEQQNSPPRRRWLPRSIQYLFPANDLGLVEVWKQKKCHSEPNSEKTGIDKKNGRHHLSGRRYGLRLLSSASPVKTYYVDRSMVSAGRSQNDADIPPDFH